MKSDSRHSACTDCHFEASCFSTLLKDEQAFLETHKLQLDYKRGENLCKQGAFVSYVIYIHSGLVKIYIESGAERSLAVKMAGPGDFMGLSALWSSRLYPYSALAMSDVSICMIEKDIMHKLISGNKDFAASLLGYYSTEDIHMFHTLRNQTMKQMHGKLADALLYLSGSSYNGKSVFSLLSRRDIAEFAGINSESVIRLLKELEQESVVALKKKDIIIKDEHKLRDISRLG